MLTPRCGNLTSHFLAADTRLNEFYLFSKTGVWLCNCVAIIGLIVTAHPRPAMNLQLSSCLSLSYIFYMGLSSEYSCVYLPFLSLCLCLFCCLQKIAYSLGLLNILSLSHFLLCFYFFFFSYSFNWLFLLRLWCSLGHSGNSSWPEWVNICQSLHKAYQICLGAELPSGVKASPFSS